MADVEQQQKKEARRKAAAKRALAEAAARRAKEKLTPLPPEIGGRREAEPTRYGDWERKGITSDF